MIELDVVDWSPKSPVTDGMEAEINAMAASGIVRRMQFGMILTWKKCIHFVLTIIEVWK